MPDLLERFHDRLLSGLAEDEVSAFGRLCRKTSYPADAVLFEEGSDAGTLYLLLDGTIDLRFALPGGARTGTTVTVDEPGEAIGWSALVAPHVYRASGYCRTAVTVLEVERFGLVPQFEANPHMGYVLMRNIAQLVGTRLTQVEQQLVKCVGEEMLHGW